MYCTQCGAPIEENLKFCTQCGARIEDSKQIEKQEESVSQQEGLQGKEVVETSGQETEVNKERVLTRPIVKSQPKPKAQVPSHMQVNRRQETDRKNIYGSKRGLKSKSYEWENRKGLNGFAETLLAIIINPIGSGEELYIRLSKLTTMIYMGAILLLSACTSYLIYIMSAGKTAEYFSEILGASFGYGTVQYVLDKLRLQVLVIAIMSNVILVIYMMALVMGIYRILLKVDIEWIECIQLMLMPMVIGFFGKVFILIASFISVPFMIFMIIVVVLLIAVLIVLQFINRLGLSALSVYSIPAVYILCSFIRVLILIQIIKGYI